MRLLSDRRGAHVGDMGWHDNVLCVWTTVWSRQLTPWTWTPHGRTFRLVDENDVGCERWIALFGIETQNEEPSRTHEGIVRRTWRRLRRR